MRNAGLAAALLSALAFPALAQEDGPGPNLEVVISGESNGTIVIDMLSDVAPLHVAQITALAEQGAYDDVAFHRVIDGFMAQTGDVEHGKSGSDMRRAGTGGSDLADLPAEFSDVQFFIMFDQGSFLNGQYTVVGRVIEGMEVVDAIKRGTGANGAVVGAPDRMSSVKVLR
jgi:peptidylprolyl isomerase